MTIRGAAPEGTSSGESEIRDTGNVVVDVAEMRNFIKDDEIRAYQERFKETMTARMKSHLDSLLANYQSTMNFSDDEWRTENDGMTMKDLNVLSDREDVEIDRQRGENLSMHVKEFFSKYFDETDSNKDGHVAAAEITAFEKANRFDRVKIPHVSFDRDAMAAVAELSVGKGLTLAQIMQAADRFKNGLGGVRPSWSVFDTCK